MNRLFTSPSLSLTPPLTALIATNWRIQMSKHWVIATAFPTFNHASYHNSLNSRAASCCRESKCNTLRGHRGLLLRALIASGQRWGHRWASVAVVFQLASVCWVKPCWPLLQLFGLLVLNHWRSLSVRETAPTGCQLSSLQCVHAAFWQRHKGREPMQQSVYVTTASLGRWLGVSGRLSWVYGWQQGGLFGPNSVFTHSYSRLAFECPSWPFWIDVPQNKAVNNHQMSCVKKSLHYKIIVTCQVLHGAWLLTPTHQLQQTKISPPESLSSPSCYSSHSREKSRMGLRTILSTCLVHFWSGVVFNGLSS